MDELLGKKHRTPAPAEAAVIGSILMDPRCIPEVLEKLKRMRFYVKLNRDIYEDNVRHVLLRADHRPRHSA